jgi:hypothetical protein
VVGGQETGFAAVQMDFNRFRAAKAGLAKEEVYQIVGPISYEAVAKGLQKHYSLILRLWPTEQKKNRQPPGCQEKTWLPGWLGGSFTGMGPAVVGPV